MYIFKFIFSYEIEKLSSNFWGGMGMQENSAVLSIKHLKNDYVYYKLMQSVCVSMEYHNGC